MDTFTHKGKRAATIVYVILITFTFITFLIGESGASSLNISLFVLALALIKGELVGAYFMGLGGIRGLWRLPIIIWLFIPGSLITIAFYLSAST
ncbi:MAG: cytochrome C oxidase subunit IV family protein [Candidatus Polarisedimenticolaceae bacterium]|nr:cytochrome C oxidase subunit IV family protein [Candidatus Polarisedimenticolaceae bacterium]